MTSFNILDEWEDSSKRILLLENTYNSNFIILLFQYTYNAFKSSKAYKINFKKINEINFQDFEGILHKDSFGLNIYTSIKKLFGDYKMKNKSL